MKSVLMHMGPLFSDEQWSAAGAIEVNLRHLDGTTCYLDPLSEAQICMAIDPLPLCAVHWIDSGDYHYLSELWMRKLKKPARLLLLDNHPDDQDPAFGGDIISCGGWVAHAKRTNPMIDDRSSALYVSIDLDILSEDYARTNWNQGDTTLPELLDTLDNAIKGSHVAGVDICGGITRAQGGTDEDFAMNRRTRDTLQEFFRQRQSIFASLS